MAHSYVDFQERSQLMHDIEIVTVVCIVGDVVRKEAGALPLTHNIKAMVTSWGSLLDTYAPGCLDLGLNDFVLSQTDHHCLRSLLEFSCTRLQRFGAIVPGDYMNEIADAPGIFEFVDRPTPDVLLAFEKLNRLLINEESESVTRAAGNNG